jgi:cyclic beta-1,2-glucan synthetase
VIGIAEWMMGANRTDRATVRTVHHSQRLTGPIKSLAEPDGAPEKTLTALLATQLDRSAGFGGGTAFLAMADANDWTCDRRECFDARGALVLPDHFDQRSGGGSDPCAALSTRFLLAAGQSLERTFFDGLHRSHRRCPATGRRGRNSSTRAAHGAGARCLGQTAGRDHSEDTRPLFDAMVNRWLMYQTVACSLWANAGFYQAGGAYGCRDQLQDSMALA